MRHMKGGDDTSSWIRIGVSFAALILMIVLAAGCTSSGSQGVSRGDTVRITYQMSFPDGPVFETSENATPLVFVVGMGQTLKGVDQAVVGMSPGQTKTIIIPPEEGYGIRNESMVGNVDTEFLVKKMQELEKMGQLTHVNFPGIDHLIYRYQLPDNTVVYYTFTNITDETTTVDQNHPLAGRELEATITLLEIVK